MTTNGIERIIRPIENNVILYYATVDEVFDILHETHSSIGHGGRNRMVYDLKKKYVNITQEVVMLYLRLCIPCQKKASNKKKGIVTKPIISNDFNSRAQVDLIDMQSQEYEGFRYIMVYQDHLTKYIDLKPLKFKRAEEIAENLLEIYTSFGAPVILQSDNGREFVNEIIENLHVAWPHVRIVHGKPRHKESQGSVERANRDVEEMLSAYMEEKNTKNWPYALKFIKFEKNRALHSGKNYLKTLKLKK